MRIELIALKEFRTNIIKWNQRQKKRMKIEIEFEWVAEHSVT